MAKNKKQIKKGQPKKSRKKKLAIIASSIVGVLVLIGAGIFLVYHYEQTKPVGNQAGQVPTASKRYTKKDFQYKKLVENAKPKQENHGLKYLFEARIKPIKQDKPEFPNADGLTRNMMTLIQSSRNSDINQAAALWTRDKANYNFTNDDNLVNAGIGHDVLIFNNYLTLTKGMTIEASTQYSQAMGHAVKTEFQTPMTMAVLGAETPPDGQVEFVKDPNSAVLTYADSGTRYIYDKQYSSLAEAEKAPEVYAGNDKKNEAVAAWKSINNGNGTNAVYEVKMDAPTGTSSIAYVVEDANGGLTVWGFYFTDQPGTITAYDYAQSQKTVTHAGASNKDIDWDRFVKATSGKGNDQ